jgi:hypothetical protein
VLLGVGHGFVSSGLFTCVGGVLYDRSGTRSISLYKGLTQLMPLFVILFFILCLGNCGAPLTLNFVGEFLSLLGVFERLPYLGLLAGISIVFSAAYTIYLFNRTAFGGVFSKFFAENISDISLREGNILLLLVLFTVILGIYPSIITDGLNYTLSTLIYEVGEISVCTISLGGNDIALATGGLLVVAHPEFARDTLRLAEWFTQTRISQPQYMDLFNTAADAVESAVNATVALGVITVPTCAVLGVLCFATFLYLRSKISVLEDGVRTAQRSCDEVSVIIENYPSTEELAGEIDIIYERVPEVNRMAWEIEGLMFTVHELFDDYLDNISLEQVEALRTVGIEMRLTIQEFISTSESLMNSATNFRGIPSPDLFVLERWVEQVSSTIWDILPCLINDYSNLLNFISG